MTEYIVPAKIDKTIAKKAGDIAMEVYKAFELAGCVRIDMLVDDDLPKVIDINTSPGMTRNLPCSQGMGKPREDLDELVEAILMEASLKI